MVSGFEMSCSLWSYIADPKRKNKIRNMQHSFGWMCHRRENLYRFLRVAWYFKRKDFKSGSKTISFKAIYLVKNDAWFFVFYHGG